MNNSLYAVIELELSIVKVRHYQGLPPQLTDNIDRREAHPQPKVLLIRANKSGIFLERFTSNGELTGDTWHMSVEDAQEQAQFEYQVPISQWKEIPLEQKDPVAFALKALASTDN